MLKADIEASLACGGLGDLRNLCPFRDSHSTNTISPPSTRERRSCAARAVSALLDWGKHRFAQEVGLLRDVLLHGEHYDGSPSMLPMVFLYGGDNSQL
jgi:hypothetical protein